jgi:hypothetical protein
MALVALEYSVTSFYVRKISKKSGTIGNGKRWETKGFAIVPPLSKSLILRNSDTPTGGTTCAFERSNDLISLI